MYFFADNVSKINRTTRIYSKHRNTNNINNVINFEVIIQRNGYNIITYRNGIDNGVNTN